MTAEARARAAFARRAGGSTRAAESPCSAPCSRSLGDSIARHREICARNAVMACVGRDRAGRARAARKHGYDVSVHVVRAGLLALVPRRSTDAHARWLQPSRISRGGASRDSSAPAARESDQLRRRILA